MSWVAIAVGTSLVAGGAGAVQSNQNRQKGKGVIGKAIDVAGQRLKLRQGDVRETNAESLAARGLTGGGMAGNDLASGTRANLATEQGLETKDLAARKDSELHGVNAAGDAGEVSSVASGIAGAFDAYANRPGAVAPLPGAAPAPRGPGVAVDGSASKYPSAFEGIDPVDPLGRGAWKSADTTGGFTKFSAENT